MSLKISPTKKTIYLARHAKSSWTSNAPNDFERPLSERGLLNARSMGLELARLNWKPDIVISSSALRANQTSLILCKNIGFAFDHIVWNKEIYGAYMVTLLHILSSQSETISSTMLVGHNPAMEDLLLHLCGEGIWKHHAQENGKLFTTGNIAKISFDDSWKNLAMHESELVQLLRPKELQR